MAKLSKISIIDAAYKLGWRAKGKLSTELLVISADKYLQQFELDKVELDEAYRNPDGSISLHCYKETQIKNILKENNND